LVSHSAGLASIPIAMRAAMMALISVVDIAYYILMVRSMAQSYGRPKPLSGTRKRIPNTPNRREIKKSYK
jgi:hypothetical protein